MGPPRGILDECRNGSVGCPHILKALQRARPRLHCFGHIHDGYGAGTVNWTAQPTFVAQELQVNPDLGSVETARVDGEFGTRTLVVNAAIMTEEYKPVNKPIYAEISLGKADSVY